MKSAIFLASLSLASLALADDSHPSDISVGQSCNSGEMKCLNSVSGMGSEYYECVHGKYELYTCGKGTACFQETDTAVYCGYYNDKSNGSAPSSDNNDSKPYSQHVEPSSEAPASSYGNNVEPSSEAPASSYVNNVSPSSEAPASYGNNVSPASAGGYNDVGPAHESKGPIYITVNPQIPTRTVTVAPKKTIWVTKDVEVVVPVYEDKPAYNDHNNGYKDNGYVDPAYNNNYGGYNNYVNPTFVNNGYYDSLGPIYDHNGYQGSLGPIYDPSVYQQVNPTSLTMMNPIWYTISSSSGSLLPTAVETTSTTTIMETSLV